jgi:hypothetical protein
MTEYALLYVGPFVLQQIIFQSISDVCHVDEGKSRLQASLYQTIQGKDETKNNCGGKPRLFFLLLSSSHPHPTSLSRWHSRLCGASTELLRIFRATTSHLLLRVQLHHRIMG